MSDVEKFLGRYVSINTRFEDYRDGIPIKELLHTEGTLTGVRGMLLEAQDFKVPLGIRCLIASTTGQLFEAEVIGFDHQTTYLMPLGVIPAVVAGAKIISTGKMHEVSVDPDLVGRVMDASGHFLDNLGPIMYSSRVNMTPIKLNPLLRALVDSPVDMGIRVLNACLPVGRGQRIGLCGAPYSGKTTLLGMMAKFSEIKRVVIGLVGFGTREIQEFIVHHLGEECLRKAVVVVARQDDPPIARLHALMRATSIAEYFRDQGEDVLLLADSLTQFIQAQCEIALMLNEPATIQGYPASVLHKVVELIERAGRTHLSSGSITACYTVSTAADGMPPDPFAEVLHAVLDGRIVLSNELAAKGYYPAVDILQSKNSAMQHYVSADQLSHIQHIKELYARQQKSVHSIAELPDTAQKNMTIAQFNAAQKTFIDFLVQAQDVRISYLHSIAALKHLYTALCPEG